MAQVAQPPPEAKPLPDPPTDGITELSYLSSTSPLLASTSWDGSVRVHDTTKMSAVLSHSMNSPLLSLATPPSDDNILVTGGLDGSISKFDMTASVSSSVGRHADGEKNACSCLTSFEGDHSSLIASAGWDSRLHLWDLRTSGVAPVSSLVLPGKAFSMDSDGQHRLVVCTSGRRTCLIDIRNSQALLKEDKESSLKYQVRTVRLFPQGMAMGSIEGRVAVDFLPSENKKKYAFKCHRVGDTVYPVNCIAFSPKYKTSFATGGCDSNVVLWDGWNKKKLHTLPKFPTSIAALAFGKEGTELAIASSYTFEEGDCEHPRDEIYVRQMLDSECQPKTTK